MRSYNECESRKNEFRFASNELLDSAAMLLICSTLLVASGCSKGPSFDNTAKLDLMLLGLEMHNVQSSVALDLESKSADAKKILQSGNYVLLQESI